MKVLYRFIFRRMCMMEMTYAAYDAMIDNFEKNEDTCYMANL